MFHKCSKSTLEDKEVVESGDDRPEISSDSCSSSSTCDSENIKPPQFSPITSESTHSGSLDLLQELDSDLSGIRYYMTFVKILA